MLQGEIWECLAGLWEIPSFTASHVGCAATPVPMRGKSQHVGTCWNHTNAHQRTKINLKIARSAKMLSSYSLTAFLPIWFARRNLEGVLNSSLVSNVHQLQSHLNTGYTNDAYAFWNALVVSVAGLLSVGLGSIIGAKLGFLNKQTRLARDATGRCASRWIFEILRCHMVLLTSQDPPSRSFVLPSKPVPVVLCECRTSLEQIGCARTMLCGSHWRFGFSSFDFSDGLHWVPWRARVNRLGPGCNTMRQKRVFSHHLWPRYFKTSLLCHLAQNQYSMFIVCSASLLWCCPMDPDSNADLPSLSRTRLLCATCRGWCLVWAFDEFVAACSPAFSARQDSDSRLRRTRDHNGRRWCSCHKDTY